MGALDAARGYKEESVRERAVSGLDESWVCEVLCASARRLTLDADRGYNTERAAKRSPRLQEEPRSECCASTRSKRTTQRQALGAVYGYKKSDAYHE